MSLVLSHGIDAATGKMVPLKVAADGTLATSGGGSGGSGGTADSTAANQVLQLAQETAINNKLPALSGGRVPVVSDVTLGNGVRDSTTTRVTIAEDDALLTRVGTTAETAPASDTASSGLNGRLQRIAQRLTSLIALLPSTLGQKTAANSLAVTMASDQARMLTETLSRPTVPRQQAATVTSANVVLTVGVTRISIFCRNADARYALGSSSQTANNATSHFIAAGERLDINVPATPNIAFIREALSTADAAIEITELST